jgi:hypothetical protein
MRFAYKRLCENRSYSEIKPELKDKFPHLNYRYLEGGFLRAENLFKIAQKHVKSGSLESPAKIIFGGKNNLRLIIRGRISKEKWHQTRNNQLLSRGERHQKGNLNLRFIELNEVIFLRVNVGKRKWIHIPAFLPKEVGKFLQGTQPYGVRILRKNKSYELRVNFEETYIITIDFKKGAIGLDFNHGTIDLAVTNSQGQLKATHTIQCYELTSSRKHKRAWLVGNLAKRVIRFAKYWKRGLVIERLKDVARGQSNQHKFAHRNFLEAVLRRAKREGVETRIVNPAFTSVIGKWKYVPYYQLTVHQAAALVIARRGQGLSEHLRRLKSLILEPMEGRKINEQVPNRRVHAWRLWRLLRGLPAHKGPNAMHLGHSSTKSEVESQGTKHLMKDSLNEDGSFRRKIASPSNGPSIRREERPTSSREVRA